MRKGIPGWAIGLVIAVVLGGGALLFRDRLSGGASELVVGDCFDVPGANTEVKDVQHHPCTEPHTGEVFHVFDHQSAAEAGYPSDPEWEQIIYPICDTAFKSYTGTDIETQQELSYTFFVPTADGWQKQNDREVICFVVRIDEAPVSRSLRASPPPT